MRKQKGKRKAIIRSLISFIDMRLKDKNNRFFITTIICILLGGLLRISFIIKYPVQPRDSYRYESTIIQWEEKKDIPKESKGVINLWILSLPHKIFGIDIIKGGIIINLIAGLFLIVIIPGIIRLIFKKGSIVLFSQLLVSTHPQLIRFSTVFLRENIFILFLSLSIYYLVKHIRRNSSLNIYFSAVTASFAFLCRLEGLEIPIIASFLIMVFQRKKSVITILLFITLYLFTTFITINLLGYNMLSKNNFLQNIDFDLKKNNDNASLYH